MIKSLVSLIQGVLKFDSATFTAHIESQDALKRGLLLMVLVALLAGFFPFASNLVASFNQPNLDDLEKQVFQQLDQQQQTNPAWRDPAFRAQFERYFRDVFEIVKAVAQLKPNVSFLPRWLEQALSAFGRWLSIPFAWIASWLGYALWVMLFAKLLGGRATLSKMLGATTLCAAPHVFDVLTSLLALLGRIPVAGPCLSGLGSLLGLGLGLWGVAVYVKATAAANEFGLGKATLAALLPAILLILLMTLAFVALLVLLIIASAKS